MVLQLIVLPVSVDLQNVLQILVYSVSNRIAEVEFVTKLLILLHIHKLKVVHVVWYLEEVILRIKQLVRVPHVILVSVIQRRMECLRRTIHRGVSGGPAV